MIFAENFLKIHHISGLRIEFDATAALKLVSTSGTDLKVEHAGIWQKYRSAKDDLIAGHCSGRGGFDIINNYDWTYTTTYKGTWFKEGEEELKIQVSSSYIHCNILYLLSTHFNRRILRMRIWI